MYTAPVTQHLSVTPFPRTTTSASMWLKLWRSCVWCHRYFGGRWEWGCLWGCWRLWWCAYLLLDTVSHTSTHSFDGSCQKLPWWVESRGLWDCGLLEQTSGDGGKDVSWYWGKKSWLLHREKGLNTRWDALLRKEPRCSWRRGFHLCQFLEGNLESGLSCLLVQQESVRGF